MHNKPYTIALIGFANSGKTTLFNHLTGSNYKTVNYPGSTVDFIKGPLLKNTDITVLDIPGINSLNPRSIDEQIAITSLSSLKVSSIVIEMFPDLIISVVDSTQRTRHLQLTKQLIDSGFNVLIALTMSDVAKKEGKTLDTQALSRKLKCPIIRFNGRSGAGLKRLSSKCLEVITKSQAPSPTIIQRSQLDIISDFNWASSTLKETKKDSLKLKKSIDGDTLLLHWALGPICFASIMSLFFYSIFALAGPLMDAIDIFFTSSASLLSNVLPSNIISTILIDGIWTGIGSVAVFIPQIAIYFWELGY